VTIDDTFNFSSVLVDADVSGLRVVYVRLEVLVG
jgi:hypothetical protein